MENLLWLLVIGAVFYFMHRRGMGCCGGHGHDDHSHGGDKQKGNQASVPASGSGHSPMGCCGGHKHGHQGHSHAGDKETADQPPLPEADAEDSRPNERKKVKVG
ncbi:MAG: hypothetical protein ACE5JS_01090 [Nitrospinota bacterium]